MSFIRPLKTERLLLREFRMEDAPTVQHLAGERDVAKKTANIPHPYEDGMAEAWIQRHQGLVEDGELVTYAVTLKPDDTLIGAISLRIETRNHLAELGYWIGKPYWNKGYCTEAARALVNLGFDDLALNRIQARHMTSNPASGRVMKKVGMTYEGTHRQATYRFGAFEDLAMYAVLRSERPQAPSDGR